MQGNRLVLQLTVTAASVRVSLGLGNNSPRSSARVPQATAGHDWGGDPCYVSHLFFSFHLNLTFPITATVMPKLFYFPQAFFPNLLLEETITFCLTEVKSGFYIPVKFCTLTTVISSLCYQNNNTFLNPHLVLSQFLNI